MMLPFEKVFIAIMCIGYIIVGIIFIATWL